MTEVGKVHGLWRYPIKSMRGEELEEAFVGFSGIYGDRLYAFKSSACEKGFPYLTGREQARMLLFRPVFRKPNLASRPEYLAEAEREAPGLNPCFDDPDNLAVEVETPSGEVLSIDDPALVHLLRQGLDDSHDLTLLRSDRALTDCRPVSLISTQTVQQLGDEIGELLDPRRFRANLYLNLECGNGFGEDDFVGRTLGVGSKAQVSILERDPRCKMITLDPDTAEMNPNVLRKVGRGHGGRAGVYGAVLVEGMVRRGDTIELLD
jgi:uncharacterized protein YcbX